MNILSSFNHTCVVQKRLGHFIFCEIQKRMLDRIFFHTMKVNDDRGLSSFKNDFHEMKAVCIELGIIHIQIAFIFL